MKKELPFGIITGKRLIYGVIATASIFVMTCVLCTWYIVLQQRAFTAEIIENQVKIISGYAALQSEIDQQQQTKAKLLTGIQEEIDRLSNQQQENSDLIRQIRGPVAPGKK